MRSWVSLLTLLLCVISFSMLPCRTTTDPASGAGIKDTLPDREPPGAHASARARVAATAGERDARRSDAEFPDARPTKAVTRFLTRFKDAGLEVYFQPDALRIGGRARFSARP